MVMGAAPPLQLDGRKAIVMAIYSCDDLRILADNGNLYQLHPLAVKKVSTCTHVHGCVVCTRGCLKGTCTCCTCTRSHLAHVHKIHVHYIMRYSLQSGSTCEQTSRLNTVFVS